MHHFLTFDQWARCHPPRSSAQLLVSVCIFTFPIHRFILMSVPNSKLKKRTRRGNAGRYRRLKKSLSRYDRFYPIYIGYSHAEPPIFEHASCALTWQLSRFMRDHIRLCLNEYPPWLMFVGTIDSELSVINKSCLQDFSNSSSVFESNFYSNVTFYELINLNNSSSGHAKVSEELFHECEATLQSQCDYMSSSKSLYKSGMKCINHPSELIRCSDGTVSAARRDNGLYEVGWRLKEFFKKSEFASYGKCMWRWHSCF